MAEIIEEKGQEVAEDEDVTRDLETPSLEPEAATGKSKPTRDFVLEKLQVASQFIASSEWANELVTILVEGNDRPRLCVLRTIADPFLVDQSALRLNLEVVDDDPRLKLTVVTSSRSRVGDSVFVDDLDKDLAPALAQVSNGQLKMCHGFKENDVTWNELLSRIRKSDLANILIECYDGNVIYRARSCRIVDESFSGCLAGKRSDLWRVQCIECQAMLSDLDEKYLGGRLLDNQDVELSAKIEIGDESDAMMTAGGDGDPSLSPAKRRRGRPKGSKNKNFTLPVSMIEVKKENDENEDPILSGEKVLVKEDDPDFLYGDDNIALFDDREDPDDKGHPGGGSSGVGGVGRGNVKRGLKQRITTKRQKALFMTKRKRGRPPTRVGPFDCPECDKSFVAIKEYRKHCVRMFDSLIFPPLTS